MAVIKVAEKYQGRGATTDQSGVRTLSRQWDVTTNSDLTFEPDVIDGVIAFDITAALYAPHPFWYPALCRKLTATPNGGPKIWIVRAEYSTAPFKANGDGSGTGGTGGAPLNPTTPDAVGASQQTPADLRAPTLSISRKEITEVLEKDVVLFELDGTTPKRVLNTLGDPFDPLPEVYRSHQVLTWKFYRSPANLDWGLRAAFMDTVNETAVSVVGCSYAAGTLRCIDYGFETLWDNSGTGLALFFALTCSAEWNPNGWNPEILNSGRRKYVSGSLNDPAHPAKLAVIVDDNGQPVADPVPLSAAGAPVTHPSNYHYVKPNAYKRLEWNGTAASIFGPAGIMH